MPHVSRRTLAAAASNHLDTVLWRYSHWPQGFRDVQRVAGPVVSVSDAPLAQLVAAGWSVDERFGLDEVMLNVQGCRLTY